MLLTAEPSLQSLYLCKLALSSTNRVGELVSYLGFYSWGQIPTFSPTSPFPEY